MPQSDIAPVLLLRKEVLKGHGMVAQNERRQSERDFQRAQP
jgi:hypothetical protein